MAGLDAYNAAATAMGGRGMGSQPSTSDQLLGTLSMGLGASDGPSPLMAGIPGQPLHLRIFLTFNRLTRICSRGFRSHDSELRTGECIVVRV